MPKYWMPALLLLIGSMALGTSHESTVAAEDTAGPSWSVKANYTDVCCCKPSCPCLFGSAPTLGFCEGITLVELESAHLGDVRLDGIKVAAVYRGGKWIKFYVGDDADETQTKAAVKLLPTFEKFFAIENVMEVKNVPIVIERDDRRVKVSVPNTTAEIEIMLGKNGEPIKVDNLPAPSFPAPPLMDHTQYKSVLLKHYAGEESFEHTGTNGFTARIEASSEDPH